MAVDRKDLINFLIFLGFMFLIVLGQGCSRKMNLSGNFGNSYESMFAAQVINPEAPENKVSPDGYPGNMADKIYDKIYEKSMTEPREKKEDISGELGGFD